MEQYAKAIILYRLLEHSHIVIPNLFGIFVLIPSEDGGPLTDNVVFSSDQRVSVLKRSAVQGYKIPYRSTTG